MKKIGIKKLLLILLLGILSISAFACGNKNEVAVETEEQESTEPTADEDGNIDEKVVASGLNLRETIEKSWLREEPTKKLQKIYEDVENVLKTTNVDVDYKLYENVYGDSESGISVWSLIKGKDEQNLDYYGLVIRNDGQDFYFPQVCHGKNPVVDYNEKKGIIYVAGGVMEGTGTHAEALYIFKVNRDGSVEQSGFVDPYEVICYYYDNMKTDVNGNEVTFKRGNKTLVKIENTDDGNGVVRYVAVGEQISYEFDDNHNITVYVQPGLKLGNNIIYFYEDTPTFATKVTINNGKASFRNIDLVDEINS